jgi:general secretion pathway protein E
MQVNRKIDFTFARGLRAILRQDPDVVLIGEIRDLETAENAVQAALTGHLVFATLHTNDAPSAPSRDSPTWAWSPSCRPRRSSR